MSVQTKKRLYLSGGEIPSPITNSWWVVNDLLLAGPYPGSKTREETSQRLGALLDVGIQHFICLQEPDERGYEFSLFPDYQKTIRRLSSADAWSFQRFPIQDNSVPSVPVMSEILDDIDDKLSMRVPVYAHCWGGHGRTGTVIGCWLVRHGIPGRRALRILSELRSCVPTLVGRACPQTLEQRRMVETWS